MAQVIAEETREADIAGRYDGEEFAMVLPHTPLSNAHVIAERLAERLRQQRYHEVDVCLTVTVSIGVAECLSGGSIASDLIQRADDQLYRAKAQDLDRVRFEVPECPASA